MPSPTLAFPFEPMDFLMVYATLSGFFIPGSQEYPDTLEQWPGRIDGSEAPREGR